MSVTGLGVTVLLVDTDATAVGETVSVLTVFVFTGNAG